MGETGDRLTLAAQGRLVGERLGADVARLRVRMAHGHELVRLLPLGLLLLLLLVLVLFTRRVVSHRRRLFSLVALRTFRLRKKRLPRFLRFEPASSSFSKPGLDERERRSIKANGRPPAERQSSNEPRSASGGGSRLRSARVSTRTRSDSTRLGPTRSGRSRATRPRRECL